jgi:hypothetical protein
MLVSSMRVNMKVANIIIAHRNPNQLLRLINQFDSKQFHNFVHIDGRCNINDYKAIVEHPNVTMISPREKLVWAGYGFVKVALVALRMIRKEGNYIYSNLISGMDFPLRPTSEFYQFLVDQHNKGPVEFFEILGLDVWPGRHRFERFHLTDVTIKGRYFAERWINKFIPKRKFWGGFVPYGRSAFFTASDKFVDYTLNYIDENPGLIRFLKTTWSPDEFIFNTLIMNSPFKDKINKNDLGHLRFIDWSDGLVSPKVFCENDFERLKQSGMFLARKFDEAIDSVILDKLEKSISVIS